MIIFIVIGSFLTLFSFYLMSEIWDKEVKTKYLSGVSAAIASVIMFVIIGGLVFVFIADVSVPRKMEYGWENKIIAMQDGTSYIISRHSVDQSDRYYYYVDYGDYYRSHWVRQSNAKIIEVSNQEYIIKTFVEKRQASNWFHEDMVRFLEFLRFDETNAEKEYEFYVPKGSVKQEFKMDLE